MKQVKAIAAIAAAATVLAASSLHATTFLLTFTSPIGSSLSGLTLDATPDGGGVYTFTSVVSGDIDGSAAAWTPSGTYFNDNLIIYPATPALDFSGITFSTAAGGLYNLYYESGLGYGIACVGGPCGLGEGAGLSSFKLIEIGTSTPEPAAWTLMLAGFAGLGAALRFRRASPVPT